MNYYISRSYNGYSAKAIPGKDLKPEIYNTFSYAVSSFGFLVNLNETIGPKEWIRRIESYYEGSNRVKKVIESITLAMPE
jgi:hypothetical protein